MREIEKVENLCFKEEPLIPDRPALKAAEQDRPWGPEANLAYEVIYRALLDATGEAQICRHHRREAREWLTNNSYEAFSLRWWLEACTAEVEHLAQEIRNYVLSRGAIVDFTAEMRAALLNDGTAKCG